jgi:hypothetical protein
MDLQEEIERLVAGYPLMSRLEQQVILGLIEAKLKAKASLQPGLRLVTVNGAVLPGSLRQSRSLKDKVAGVRA